MKLNVECCWGNHSTRCEDTLDVSSFDNFIKQLEDFLAVSCGVTAVDSFNVNFCGECFYWDNDTLPRNKDLSDVWNGVEKDLKEFWNRFFKE